MKKFEVSYNARNVAIKEAYFGNKVIIKNPNPGAKENAASLARNQELEQRNQERNSMQPDEIVNQNTLSAKRLDRKLQKLNSRTQPRDESDEVLFTTTGATMNPTATTTLPTTETISALDGNSFEINEMATTTATTTAQTTTAGYIPTTTPGLNQLLANEGFNFETMPNILNDFSFFNNEEVEPEEPEEYEEYEYNEYEEYAYDEEGYPLYADEYTEEYSEEYPEEYEPEEYNYEEPNYEADETIEEPETENQVVYQTGSESTSTGSESTEIRNSSPASLTPEYVPPTTMQRTTTTIQTTTPTVDNEHIFETTTTSTTTTVATTTVKATTTPEQPTTTPKPIITSTAQKSKVTTASIIATSSTSTSTTTTSTTTSTTKTTSSTTTSTTTTSTTTSSTTTTSTTTTSTTTTTRTTTTSTTTTTTPEPTTTTTTTEEPTTTVMTTTAEETTTEESYDYEPEEYEMLNDFIPEEAAEEIEEPEEPEELEEVEYDEEEYNYEAEVEYDEEVEDVIDYEVEPQEDTNQEAEMMSDVPVQSSNIQEKEETEEVEEVPAKKTSQSGKRNLARRRQQSSNNNSSNNQQAKNAETVTEELTDFTCLTCRGKNWSQCLKSATYEQCQVGEVCRAEIRKRNGQIRDMIHGCKQEHACNDQQKQNFTPEGTKSHHQCRPFATRGPSVCRACCSSDNCTKNIRHDYRIDWIIKN